MFWNHHSSITSLSCAYLQEFFQKDAMRLPELDGVMYLKEGKRSWKKHYFVLRASGIYYTPKGKTKVCFHNCFTLLEDTISSFSFKKACLSKCFIASCHAVPQSWLNWKLEMLVFNKGGKPDKSGVKPWSKERADHKLNRNTLQVHVLCWDWIKHSHTACFLFPK